MRKTKIRRVFSLGEDPIRRVGGSLLRYFWIVSPIASQLPYICPRDRRIRPPDVGADYAKAKTAENSGYSGCSESDIRLVLSRPEATPVFYPHDYAQSDPPKLWVIAFQISVRLQFLRGAVAQIELLNPARGTVASNLPFGEKHLPSILGR